MILSRDSFIDFCGDDWRAGDVAEAEPALPGWTMLVKEILG
jgi:hypothetical protein